MITNSEFKLTLDTWIISDTHFFHKNIGRYCNRPEDWQEMIIENWNRLIAPDDQVLHLGDFAFGKKSHFRLLTGDLKGRLYLICGNHDRFSNAFYETCGAIVLEDPFMVEMYDQTRLVFSHRPIVPLEEGVINFHGHIHNNPPPPEGSTLGPHHINMSVEVREYRPWRLCEMIEQRVRPALSSQGHEHE